MDADKKKVLLVDDDKFLLNMYARKLDHSGFAIETADNAMLAYDKIKAGYAPDVLLVDIVMPGMDGIELVRKLKTENLLPKVKIVMLTNQSESPDIKIAKDIGVDGYIIKATTIPSEVVTRVREIMAGKRYIAEAL